MPRTLSKSAKVITSSRKAGRSIPTISWLFHFHSLAAQSLSGFWILSYTTSGAHPTHILLFETGLTNQRKYDMAWALDNVIFFSLSFKLGALM